MILVVKLVNTRYLKYLPLKVNGSSPFKNKSMFSNSVQLNFTLRKNKKHLNKFSFKLYHWLLKLPNSLIYCKKIKINFFYLTMRLKKRIDFFLFSTLFTFLSLKETRFWIKFKNFVTINNIKIKSNHFYLTENDFLAINPIWLPEILKN